jgi:Ser/Thr protein kinase RdoA (MazF antagonist)
LPELLASDWPAGIAHGDYFAGNVLFDGSRIGGIVDWSLFEAVAPQFLDPLTYELSFGLHAVQHGPPPSGAELRAVHALPAFAAARERAAERGMDWGLASAARLAVLVWSALRDGESASERAAIGRSWVTLLAAEVTKP